MTIRILNVRKPANSLNGHLWKNDCAPKSDALTQRLLRGRNLHRSYEGIDWLHLRHYDLLLAELEHSIEKTARSHDPVSLALLRTIPGVGNILALVMLYEIEDITRFPQV
jgi:transposase